MSDNEAPKRPTEGKEEDFNNHWPEEFEKWWKPLLQTDGQWDPEKIKNELHDLVFTYTQIDIIYSHITGGKLSKPNYFAGTIIREFDDQMTKSYAEGHKDGYDEGYEEGLAEGDHGDREIL
jgi:hypothetical protein